MSNTFFGYLRRRFIPGIQIRFEQSAESQGLVSCSLVDELWQVACVCLKHVCIDYVLCYVIDVCIDYVLCYVKGLCFCTGIFIGTGNS